MLRVLKSSLIVLVYASFVSAVANSPREVSVDGVIARGSVSHWDTSLLQSTRCASDDDCGDDPGGHFVCYNGQCVDCKNEEDCTDYDDAHKCNFNNHRCAMCVSNDDCSDDENDYICVDHVCIPETSPHECETNRDCGSLMKCSEDGECVFCLSDNDCSGGSRCNLNNHWCVECLKNDDCGDNITCIDNVCIASSLHPWAAFVKSSVDNDRLILQGR